MKRVSIALAVALVVAFLIARAVEEERKDDPVPVPDERGQSWRPGQRALGAAVTIEPARDSADYRDEFAETFTSLTPENAMKWERVAPDRGDLDLREATVLVDWARALGKRVRGHPAVWDHQLPRWLTERRWRADELEAVLRAHVRGLVGAFRGRVESWDVVNEPFEDDGTWTPSVFHRTLGERYVEVALRAARDVDPDARLFINEIAAERPGRKLDALLALAARLKRRGVPLDGIGLQNHTKVQRFPSRDTLEDTMRRVAALGLDVEITEMDVTLPPAGGDLERQAAAYGAAAEACRAVPRCTGLTVWGVNDAVSWLGAPRRPTLLDTEGRPKPALRAVTDALG